MTGARPDGTGRPNAFLILPVTAFLVSGASAIVCQICWQRLLTVSSGTDTISMATVVAAFMVGLGVGNLLGGGIADRLAARTCIIAYVVVEIVTAAVIWFSPFFLYRLYGRLAPSLDGVLVKFLIEVLILVVPTLLMGANLPILARGLVRAVPGIAGTVGKLYGANTLGAALGALLLTGPWLLGRFGIAGTVRFAAVLNILAAVVVVAALAIHRRATAPTPPARDEADPARVSAPGRRSVIPWLCIYGLSGFIALSFEVLWFRMLQVVLIANTYTFALLLCFYLAGIGLGAWLAGFFVSRIDNAARAFLLLQFAVSQVGTLGPLLVYTKLSRRIDALGGLPPLVEFAPGLGNKIVLVALIVLPATLLMGASYPFVQKLVAQDLDSLGRRTGALLFANTVGAFLGSAVTGLALLHVLGTPRSLLLMGFLGLVFLAASIRRPASGAVSRTIEWALVVLPLAFLAVYPSSRDFWAAFYRVAPDSFYSHEDRTGAAALKFTDQTGNKALIAQSGGFWQTPFPFDNFHLTLGLLPLLAHEQPDRALAIGLGIGSSPSAMAADPRLNHLDVVEIAGGEEPLLRRHLGDKPEMKRLFENPKVRIITDDGRRFLLHNEERYDIIVSDPTLIWWACGTCLYTKEFYELLRSRLTPGGIVAQWVPTDRTVTTAASVFDYQTVLHGEGFYLGIMLLSQQPIAYDKAEALHRLDATLLERHEYRLVKAMIEDGEPFPPPPPTATLNTDLFPRDEYQ